MALLVNNLLLQMLALTPYVLAYVPPPVNVSAVCHNFHNVIYWNYSEPSLRPQFNVTIATLYSKDSIVCSNTSLYHCDVSSFTKEISNGYRIIVTAAVGPHTNSSDILLSYDETMDSDVECWLDFPPVNISVASKEMIKVQFPHPLDKYKNDIRKDEMENHDLFKYQIVTDNLTLHSLECSYIDDYECLSEIPIDAAMDRHCIRINGKLNYVQVSAQEMICTKGTPDFDHGYIALYCIIPLIVAGVIALFISMWLRRKLKSSFSTFPRSMLSHGLGNSLLTPQSETLSYLQTDDSFLPEAPEPNENHTPTSIPQEEEGRFPMGVTDSEEYGGDKMSSNEGSGSSLGETIGLEQDTEKDLMSGYDSCHVPVTIVEEEMSPGDMVTGYRT
uniref:Fibronectin type-III domain-containing protein n=1 Tax=Esox lucius TaxID=8010 RepID=A0AAY5L2X3_ESOLU